MGPPVHGVGRGALIRHASSSAIYFDCLLEKVGTVDDLDSRSGIHDLVVGFYREVVFDDLLAPVFGEVAEVDWSTHIPKLIDYWCRVLLGDPGYDGALLAAHRHVHELAPLRLEHLDRWYTLWVEGIDRTCAGPTAERAKRHAARVGRSLSHRLLGSDWLPPGQPTARSIYHGQGESNGTAAR
jgi:hemoglobin